jgi:hypothetical protein
MGVDQATKHYTYHSMATLMIAPSLQSEGKIDRERERALLGTIHNGIVSTEIPLWMS